MKKEKKYIAPNEASLKRWFCVLLVHVLIGNVLAFPVGMIFSDKTATILGVSAGAISDMLTFVAMFVSLVIAMKLVANTSFKDFTLGVGGKINKKECLIILGLSLISYCLSVLPNFGQIHMRDVSLGTWAFSALFTLALIWMQTTWEEILFRGILLRWICKNNITINKKTLLVAVITSLLFGVSHITNPEFAYTSGFEKVIVVLIYAVPGITYFLMDLYFGSLMPGMIMHYVNNAMLCILINAEVSALALPSLMVTNDTQLNIYIHLLAGLMTKIPFVAYVLWDIYKKNKAAASC